MHNLPLVAQAKPRIQNPSLVIVGDSITQFGMRTVSLNGIVVTRDINGLLSIPKSGHQLYGNPNIFLGNMPDLTYEAYGQKITVDANNFQLQTNVTGAAGTSTGTANTVAVHQSEFEPQNFFFWLNSLASGGFRCFGVLGKGGAQTVDVVNTVRQAIALNPDIVVIEIGINDNFGNNQPISSTFGNIVTLIDMVVAAGKRALVLAITPPFHTYGAYSATKMANALAVNAMVATYCNAKPSVRKFADIATPMYDAVTLPATPGAFSWATNDTLHPSTTAFQSAIGPAIFAALADWCVFDPILPTVSGTGQVANYTKVVAGVGPWATTSGGALAGSAPPTGAAALGWNLFGVNGSSVASIFNDPDGLGVWQKIVWTPGAGGQYLVLPLNNGTVTLASLGLSVGDTIMVGMEVDVAGAQASNYIGVEILVSNGIGGGVAAGSDSQIEAAGSTTQPDAYRARIFTGTYLIPAGETNFGLQIDFRASASSASPVTLMFRRFTIFKVLDNRPLR